MPLKAASHTALPQSLALPFPAAPAIMADVVADQAADQKAVLNGEVEDRDEADPVEETAKKKKKKKKKNKSATAGEAGLVSVLLAG